MRCLVTGASGFLGASLVRYLVRREHQVLVLLRPQSAPARLKDCLPHLRPVYGDLANTEVLRRAIQQHPIDAVAHLAWFGVTAEYRNRPEQISQNLVSTLAVWEASRTAGCKVWVGLGSQAEYGPCSGILREDMPLRPATGYWGCQAGGWPEHREDVRTGRHPSRVVTPPVGLWTRRRPPTHDAHRHTRPSGGKEACANAWRAVMGLLVCRRRRRSNLYRFGTGRHWISISARASLPPFATLCNAFVT